MKEISQLHTRKALLSCDRNAMTYDERKKALRYLMYYLSMKIDYRQKGKVKFVMYEYIDKML